MTLPLYALSLLHLFYSGQIRRDDLRGKIVQPKQNDIRPGYKSGKNLVREGEPLDPAGTYYVKSHDGVYVELDDGFVLKSEVKAVPHRRPFLMILPSMVKRGDWIGKTISMKRHHATIHIYEYKDGVKAAYQVKYQVSYKVLDDQNGFVQVDDGSIVGWVDKTDFVLMDRVEKFCEMAIKNNTRDPFPLYMRANTNRANGLYEAAIRDYSRIAEMKPDDQHIHFARASCYEQIGDYSKAIQDCEIALQRTRDKATVYQLLATLHYKTGDYEQLILFQTLRLQEKPKDFEGLCDRGASLRLANRNHEAIADFNKAISRDPLKSRPYSLRAVSCAILGQYHQAALDFERALELKASPLELREYVHFLLYCPDDRFHNTEKAILIAKEAVSSTWGTDASKMFDTLATAYAKDGDFAMAVETQQNAVRRGLSSNIDYQTQMTMELRLDFYRQRKLYQPDDPSFAVRFRSQ
ncbi:MAG: tetratricopeptide repeat protein [Fimbriiglobus sp.]